MKVLVKINLDILCSVYRCCSAVLRTVLIYCLRPLRRQKYA